MSAPIPRWKAAKEKRKAAERQSVIATTATATATTATSPFSRQARIERQRAESAKEDAILAAEAAARAAPPVSLVHKYKRLSPGAFDTHVWLLFKEKEEAAMRDAGMTEAEWLVDVTQNAHLTTALANGVSIHEWLVMDAEVKKVTNLRTDGDWEPEPFYAMPVEAVTDADAEALERLICLGNAAIAEHKGSEGSADDDEKSVVMDADAEGPWAKELAAAKAYAKAVAAEMAAEPPEIINWAEVKANFEKEMAQEAEWAAEAKADAEEAKFADWTYADWVVTD